MARLYLFGFAHHLGVGVPIDINSRSSGSGGYGLAFLLALYLTPGLYLWKVHEPAIAWPIITELILLYAVTLLVELGEPFAVSNNMLEYAGLLWVAPGLYWWWVNDAHMWWLFAVELTLLLAITGLIKARRNYAEQLASQQGQLA